MAHPAWQITGEYFESCNCEVLCPCLLSRAQARPTEGHCDVVVASHADSGRYGDTPLDGLSAVLTIYTPGVMAQGDWTVACYVDERANAAQRHGLEAIFSAQAGGPLGRVSPPLPQPLVRPMSKKEVVLVHGACHGAWCWEAVAERLAAKGHAVVTLDLPGHGRRASEYATASVANYARAVVDAMALEGISRGIVVGHSMGGLVIPKVVELAPGRGAHLGFLAAVELPA